MRAFVKKRRLEDDFAWLCRTAPLFFKDSHLEVQVSYGANDEDDSTLDLMVYNPRPLTTFLKEMDDFYELMHKEGRKELYETVSITHWRRQDLDGKLFLETARFLRDNGNIEADYRSAVSRAYYACYLELAHSIYSICPADWRSAGCMSERHIRHRHIRKNV